IFINLNGEKIIPVQKDRNSLSLDFHSSGSVFTLSHEMAHAEDYDDDKNREMWGQLRQTEYKGLKILEWNATYVENQIRYELDAPLRVYYIVKMYMNQNQTQEYGGAGPEMI